MQASIGFRWSDDKVLDQTADMLARLALGAEDGEQHKDPTYPRLTQYPTRRRVEELVRTALTPQPDADPGYQRGFSLEQLLAATWDRIDGDPGDDDGAKELLEQEYEAITGGAPWAYSPGAVDLAIKALASYSAGSLWLLFVEAAYPDHPQTPGSPGWQVAEAGGNPHESVANPWTRKP